MRPCESARAMILGFAEAVYNSASDADIRRWSTAPLSCLFEFRVMTKGMLRFHAI